MCFFVYHFDLAINYYLNICFAANAGAAAGAILFFATYVPFFFIGNRYYTMSTAQKIASCLLHNLAMAMAFQQIGNYESLGKIFKVTQPTSMEQVFSIFENCGKFVGITYGGTGICPCI